MYMKSFFTKLLLPLCLALPLPGIVFVSCDKDNYTKGGLVKPEKLEGTVVSKGVCNAFNATSESAQMCFVERTGTYYIDYFCNGDGSFGFTWDKTTNRISIIEFETGLFSGMYPIDFLSQKDYEAEMGEAAEPSFFNPETKLFTFNVLYQTAIADGVLVRNPAKITYQPKE